MTFVSGQKVRASELNALPTYIVGRNQRTTAMVGITAITRIISTIATVESGRSYRVTCHNEMDTANAGVFTQSELRYTIDNTEPTTASTVLNRALNYHATNVGIPVTTYIEGLYVASSTVTLRVALCVQRASGAGNIAIQASSTNPTDLIIQDCGPTVSVSGTIY